MTTFEPFVELFDGWPACDTGSMAKRKIDIEALSDEERLSLIEELWESIGESRRDSIPLTPYQEAELARRLEAHEREGSVGITAEELHEKLRRRGS